MGKAGSTSHRVLAHQNIVEYFLRTFVVVLIFSVREIYINQLELATLLRLPVTAEQATGRLFGPPLAHSGVSDLNNFVLFQSILIALTRSLVCLEMLTL